MPRYELMYILASSVSDDQIPATTEQIESFVTALGATDISHTQLGKKKLAYPIKKTRNGHYGVIAFTMDSSKVGDLDAKIRTQGNTIIRYIIVNMDEHFERMEKDRVAQAAMNRNRPASQIPDEERSESAPAPRPAAPAKEVTAEEIDESIEKALSEDITK